jgi:TolB-like protein/tetratricopeptide (TPR) repeat protein
MQVLVALAQRQGQVVSRDALVEMCWGGRAVSEDAIQRAIAKVRKLGETSGAFHIDTVARVGYRLRADGHAPATPAPSATNAASEPVLVVLPFDNLSDDREMQFFSDGVSEEILQSMVRARGLKVIGRTSSFQFRGADKVVRRVANELGATHVVDGSIRRAGNRVRISAALIEAGTQTTLWADQYDRDLTHTFTLQTEISAAIAGALSATLVQSASVRPIDPTAYDLWLRARELIIRDLSDVPAAEATALLEQTVVRAPDFAQGWAWLAGNRAALLPRTHDALDSPIHHAALAAAVRALSLDSTCADAYRVLAMLKPAFAEHAEKLRLLRQAVALAPNDPLVAFVYGGALHAVGRMREALPYYRLAAQLEPLAPYFVCSCALVLSSIDRVNEAAKLIDDAWHKFPGSQVVWFSRAQLRGRNGGLSALADEFAGEAPLKAGMPEADVLAFRGLLSTFRLPEPERARAITLLLDPNAPMLWIGICKLAAEVGHADAAFRAFDAAFKSGQPIAAYTSRNMGIPRAIQSIGLFYHDGEALRRDPRFARVCAKLGLVDCWTTSGHWPDCADEVPYDFRAECAKAAAELAKA